MSDPASFFVPGPDRDNLLKALAEGHGYNKHVARRGEFGGRDVTSPAAYRGIAERVLAGGERGLLLNQADGDAVLIGSRREQAVLFINVGRVDKSTMFRPTGGVDRYLDSRAHYQDRGGVSELALGPLRLGRSLDGAAACRTGVSAWRSALRNLDLRGRSSGDLGLER